MVRSGVGLGLVWDWFELVLKWVWGGFRSVWDCSGIGFGVVLESVWDALGVV